MPETLHPTGAIRASLSWLLYRIDAFIFPPLCVVCDRPRRQRAERWLCSICLKEIERTIASRDACPRCGQNRDVRMCGCDIVWDFPFSRIISFVDYTETVQSIMHQIKYNGKKRLAEYMGRVCAAYFDNAAVAPSTVVVPVPLHWLRRHQRGFNQAEWFASGLFAERSDTKVKNGILRRVRMTKTQTRLDRSSRRNNVAGAFALASGGAELIKGKPVILVDDVVTTGATTSEAASVLLSAGCESVTVVSFARD